MVYHYTTATAVSSIFRAPNELILWATLASHLNDTSEIETGRKLVIDIIDNSTTDLELEDHNIEYLRGYFSSNSAAVYRSNIYLTCFSEAIGRVDQWRGYGAYGSGFAIGFNVEDIERSFQQIGNAYFLKCIYKENEQRSAIVTAARSAGEQYRKILSGSEITIKDDKGFQSYGIARAIEEQVLRMKHGPYESEQEWRLVIDKNVGIRGLLLEYLQNETKFRASLGTYPVYRS